MGEKLKKLGAILLFPVVVFGFVIGWALYWIGSHQKEKAKLMLPLGNDCVYMQLQNMEEER